MTFSKLFKLDYFNIFHWIDENVDNNAEKCVISMLFNVFPITLKNVDNNAAS